MFLHQRSGEVCIFARNTNFRLTVFIGNVSTPSSKIEWTSMDDPLWKLDAYSLKPLTPAPHHMVESDEIGYHDYSLVVSGDIFRWMINYAPLETLQRVRIEDCKG